MKEANNRREGAQSDLVCLFLLISISNEKGQANTNDINNVWMYEFWIINKLAAKPIIL